MFSRFSAQCKQTHREYTAGFGLIELMVSISIMLLVTAIVLVRQNSFNSAVLLRSQAYEVALSAREVQLNAVSTAVDITGNNRTLMGLHFDTYNDSAIRVFKDSFGGNGYYNAGEEFGKQISLDSHFEVRGIRKIVGGTETSVSNLSVVFERPNFDARFFESSGEVNASSVEIDITTRDAEGSGADVLRTVEVTSTGQITVHSPTEDD